MSNLEINVRALPVSITTERQIHRLFRKLNRMNSKIIACSVAIDFIKNHSFKDKVYNIKTEVKVPGKQFITKKQNKNLYLAIRDSFLAIQRLLEKHFHKHAFYFDKRNFYKYAKESVNLN
jgi:ribosome-associated translation inhibitor RaiA